MIPKAEQYFDNGMNVLLIGLHGVGKTEAVLEMCRAKDVTLKYYSCSTLDPFTDLVGVPTPRHYCVIDKVYFMEAVCPGCKRNIADEGTPVIEALKMVRPHEIDSAELLFFDEFNRADEKTQNAVFEIIQFKSINGERLQNAVACWAAMNPPDGDYKVSDLDPALIDRFDVFIDIQAKPAVAWMAGPGGLPKPIAQALFSWWGEHNNARRGMENYISPRRLYKIGQVYVATGDFRPALPKWVKADREKLAALLEKAEADMKKLQATRPSGKLGGGPNIDFTYDKDWISAKRMAVSKYLKENQQDFDTHNAVLAVLEPLHGKTLARDYAEIMDNLKPSVLEGFVNSLNSGKLTSLKQAIADLPTHRRNNVPNLRREVGLP